MRPIGQSCVLDPICDFLIEFIEAAPEQRVGCTSRFRTGGHRLDAGSVAKLLTDRCHQEQVAPICQERQHVAAIVGIRATRHLWPTEGHMFVWKRACHEAIREQDRRKKRDLSDKASQAMHRPSLELANAFPSGEKEELEETRRKLTIRELQSNAVPP